MSQERTGHVVLSEASYPVLCVEIHGAVSDSEWQRYLDWYEARLKRAHMAGDRVVLLCDTTHATHAVTPLQRKQQADLIAQNRYPNVMTGLAAVITNRLVRGAMTALMWIQPMPFDYIIAATRTEAERWAADKVHRRGADVSQRPAPR